MLLCAVIAKHAVPKCNTRPRLNHACESCKEITIETLLLSTVEVSYFEYFDCSCCQFVHENKTSWLRLLQAVAWDAPSCLGWQRYPACPDSWFLARLHSLGQGINMTAALLRLTRGNRTHHGLLLLGLREGE